MDSLASIGRWLVIAGLALAVIGGLSWLLGRLGWLNNFPGTLRFTFAGATCIIPILASIVLSVVLTLILNLVVRLLNR